MESSDARQANKAAILRLIVGKQEITRPEIVEATRLSKATVSRLVRELISEGMLTEGPLITPVGAGRPTQVLRFCGGAGRVCGVDIGVSNSRFILTDYHAALIRAWTEPTSRLASAEALADWVADRVLAASHDGQSPVVTAIGLPGAVVPEDGRVLHAPNMPQIEGPGFSERLAERLSGGVRLENDANIALIGEITVGAGAGTEDVVMFTVGAGLGAGVLLDGDLLTGRHGLVGEFGSVPLGDGRLLEEMLSAPGIVTLGRELQTGDEDPARILRGKSSQHSAVRERVTYAVQVACSMAWAAYEPDLIVLGGRVAPSLAPLLPEVQTRLDRALTLAPRVCVSTLSDYAGALGAIAIALETAYRLLGAAEGGIFDPRLRDELSRLAAQVQKG
ncbi:ROK family transcriptional regulator [Spirillospora sp. CA-255316]